MSQNNDSGGLTVGKMIEHLKKMDPELPIYYVMFDEGYKIIKLTEKDVFAQELENHEGEPFAAIVIGEEWLG